MNLKRIRTAKGVTARELAQACGISASAISMIENGKRDPSYEVLLKLSEALDCSVADIVGEEGLTDLGFSAVERIIIQKYRSLDEYGKKAVEAVLDAEASRKVIDLSDVAMVARGGKKIPAGYEEDLKKMVEIMLGDAEK